MGYPGWGMGAVAADFDNDGWDDLYVTCYGPNRLYRNNGDGTFADVTDKAGVGDPRWSTGAAFADYDGDGWLDLFVANYVDVRLEALPEFGKGKFCEFRGIPVQCGPRGLPGSGDSLYRNKGDGTFEDVSKKLVSPIRAGGSVWVSCGATSTATAGPISSSPTMRARTFSTRTLATARSSMCALQAGTALSEDGKEQGSMGVAVGDYDHSGGWSIFVTNFADDTTHSIGTTRVFSSPMCPSPRRQRKPASRLSAGARTFSTTTTTAGSTCWSSTVTSTRKWRRPGTPHYAQRKLLYHNNQNGTFTESTSTAGAALSAPSVSRGSAVGDLDNDGDLDVVINNLDGAPTVLRNDGGNRPIFSCVDLEGRSGNRGAIGAVVTVRAADLVQRGERRSGDSYLSHSDGRLHFGLGTRTKADSVEVRWPNGSVQVFREIPANAFLRIVEGEQSPQTIPRAGARQ